MNPEIFAEWLRRQGHQVAKTASSYWYDQGPRVYQAFPYHSLITPSEEEISEFLQAHGAIGLRYSTPLSSREGAVSYHAVCEDRGYDLDGLKVWARKNVRRGLRNCTVEQISFDLLAQEGWELQLDTVERQGRRLPLQKHVWRQRCVAAGELTGFEAWGAFVRGHLAASVIAFRMADCAYLLYQQCHRDFLPLHVNNALSFTVTSTLLHRPHIRTIFYGLHSLDAPESVDEFKFRMGYTARPVRQRILFNPQLSFLFGKPLHAITRKLLWLRPGNATLAKAEGMIRFYLDGKRPMEQQNWPHIMQQARDEVNSGEGNSSRLFAAAN